MLARLIVAVVELPGVTKKGLRLEEEIEKSAITVTEIVTECASDPLVPVTVIVYVPVGVEPIAWTLIVLVACPVARLAGLVSNENVGQLVPQLAPVMDWLSETLPANWSREARLIVE
jgi:hypothetical protein